MANYTNSELQDWWIGKARSAAGYRRNIINNHERGSDAAIIGKLFFFYYDPKLKKVLPIYDRFPLVFPIEPYADGFLGLNIHYLSVSERSGLIDRLKDYTNNNKFDKSTKLRLTYDLLASTKRLASDARPCIKRYLFSQVRSKFVEITADEWDRAAQLPVELFVRKG